MRLPLLFSLIFSFLTVLSFHNSSAWATTFTLDSFQIEKGGQVLFLDTFDSGGIQNPSPGFVDGGGNQPTNYFTGIKAGETFTKSNGRIELDPINKGGDITGFPSGDPIGSQSARVFTSQDVNSSRSLNQNSTFKITGIYDLILPGSAPREAYGIGLFDGVLGHAATEYLHLDLRRTSDGQVSIAFIKLGVANTTLTLIDSILLDLAGNPDQISFMLEKADANSDDITASFSYLLAGNVISETIFANTADIFNDVAITRARFRALDFRVSAVPVPAALPLFGTGLAIIGFVGWRRRKKKTSAATA